MKINKKGFSLIELLVVVIIIGIIAAWALPAYFRSVERSRVAEVFTYTKSLIDAEERYFGNKGYYNPNFKLLDISLRFNNESYQTPDDKCVSDNCFNTPDYSYELVDTDIIVRRERSNKDVCQYYFIAGMLNPRLLYCIASTKDAENICEDLRGTYIEDRNGERVFELNRF